MSKSDGLGVLFLLLSPRDEEGIYLSIFFEFELLGGNEIEGQCYLFLLFSYPSRAHGIEMVLFKTEQDCVVISPCGLMKRERYHFPRDWNGKGQECILLSPFWAMK